MEALSSALNKKFDKKFIYFCCLMLFIATLFRIYSIVNFGFFNNDDIVYFQLSQNLFSGKGFIYDFRVLVPQMKNVHDGIHVHFPPGYPLIIGLESLIFKYPKIIRSFEWIFLSGFNSILLTFISCKLVRSRKYIAAILSFLSPVLIFGVATITIGSENWFVTVSLLGLLFCFFYSRNFKFIFLLIANLLFSFSYLIRPEGILFYTSTIFISLLHLKRIYSRFSKTYAEKISELIALIASFIIPIFLLIAPYIFFLYKELGKFTLTGKSLNWEELDSIKTSINYLRYLNNSISLFDIVFTSPFFLGISFFLVFSFVLLGLFTENLQIKTTYIQKYLRDIFIFSGPLPFAIYAYIKNDPYSRSIYCFIPSIILTLILLSEVYGKYFNYSRKITLGSIKNINLSPIFLVILFCSLFNLSVPLFYSNFMANSPSFYYKGLDQISRVSKKTDSNQIIWSRDLSGSLINTNFVFCNAIEEIENTNTIYPAITVTNKSCNGDIDYFLLSNFNHDSMPAMTDWEKNNFSSDSFVLNKKTYVRFFTKHNKRNSQKLVGFKLIKDK